MKKVLVTGGAGFIGTNLCKKLLSENYKVIAIDNFITSNKKNVELFSANKNYVFIRFDITQKFPEKMLSALKGVRHIYHLACPTGVPNVVHLAEEMLMTCSVGTKNVLEIARMENASFLLASSSEVYGDPQVFPQTEEYAGNVHTLGVRSPYEEGKRFAESMVRMYVYKYGIDAKIVRIFNTYGPHMSKSDTRVIPRFIRQLKGRKPLTIQGNGSQTRTFCYVDDLVRGLETVMEKGGRGEVYNLGSDNEISILTAAETALAAADAKDKITFINRPTHDHQRRQPSIKKIKLLGWQPKIPLAQGIVKTLESLQLKEEK